MKPATNWLGIFLGALSVIFVSVAVAVIGPPSRQRDLRMDEMRLRDLAGIVSAADAVWKEKGELPRSLAELTETAHRKLKLEDPETGAPYGYKVKDARSYEVCADFKRQSREHFNVYMALRQDWNWDHGPGPHCFEFETLKRP
jgi:hypothetical protein